MDSVDGNYGYIPVVYMLINVLCLMNDHFDSDLE
jgi:hypothetical protein